jgi:uncharacterized membrane protein HdeD (DUF308 family)
MAFDISATVELARWWWTFIVRGVLAIAFGILAFFAPLFGIAILVGLFAAWALIDGVTDIVTGIRTRDRDRNWWLLLLEGIVGIVVAAIALLLPAFAATALVIIIAAWAIITGAFEIAAAIRLREQIRGEFWLGLAGVASILFGVVLLLFPEAGALSLVWLIGGFSFAFGAFLVVLGIRLRTINELAKRDAAHDYGQQSAA